MSHEHFESKKARKEAQNKKNRKHQQIFQFLRLRRQEEARVKDLDEKQAPRSPSEPEHEVNDKVAQIRNRLTGQKRVSKERWNRFAGTSSAGRV